MRGKERKEEKHETVSQNHSGYNHPHVWMSLFH